MNALAILASAVAVSAITAAAVTSALSPSVVAAPGPTAASVDARVQTLEAEVARVRSEFADLRAGDPERQEVERAVDPAMIEAAVARHLAAHGTVVASAPDALDRTRAIARLGAVGGDYDRIEEVWKDIEAADLEDEVLAHFAALAEAAPRDADMQYLHGAYLLASIESESMARQGELAEAADAAFARALEVDGEHWGARFLKATSLSFWPKITGKQAEAVEHFRILADQQERGRVQPHFVHTYLFLGNMLAAEGDREGARAVYERGIRCFPGDADLKRQLAALAR